MLIMHGVGIMTSGNERGKQSSQTSTCYLWHPKRPRTLHIYSTPLAFRGLYLLAKDDR